MVDNSFDPRLEPGMATGESHPVWNRIFLALELVCVPVILWWVPYSHLPEPGWAVALIAGAAAAMSVHDGMKGWQKCIWLLVIGAFLITELRAIHKDHIDNDAKALADRKQQDLAFKVVRETQEADFKTTARGMESAVAGIESTLQMSKATLLQTRPIASIALDDVQFQERPGKFKANYKYSFNYWFTNVGSEIGTSVKVWARVYTGKADDLATENNLAGDFNQEWDQIKNDRTKVGPRLGEIEPHVQTFMSVDKMLTENELSALINGGTIYYLVRFEYSDRTGRWRTDDCRLFQRESTSVIDVNITHSCEGFKHPRYAVKQRP